MRSKPVLWLLLGVLLLSGTACRTVPPFVQDNGPSVVRTGTSFAMQFALVQAQLDPATVTQIRSYLVDARGVLKDGSMPSYTLDVIAAKLNQVIPYEGVRQAIQAGILALKQYVEIPPANEAIGDKLLVWVYAVLDGAIDGCDAYLGGYARGGATPRIVPTEIKFRDAQVAFNAYGYYPVR